MFWGAGASSAACDAGSRPGTPGRSPAPGSVEPDTWDQVDGGAVGWKAARSMTKELVLDALNMAAWTRRRTSLTGLTCHSDAGVNTRPMHIVSDWPTSAPLRRSAPSAQASTTPWPRR